MTTEIADEIFIFMRTHSPTVYKNYQTGINYALQNPRTTTKHRRSNDSSDQNSNRNQRQRIGAPLFDEIHAQNAFTSVMYSEGFSEGESTGHQINELLKEDDFAKEAIQTLFESYAARLPPGERYVHVPSESRLLELFSFKNLSTFTVDTRVTSSELSDANIFDNVPTFANTVTDDTNGNLNVNIDELTIEDLVDHTPLSEYVDRDALQHFLSITVGDDYDASKITEDDLRRYVAFFKCLQRGDFSGESRALVLLFITQCKFLPSTRPYIDRTSRQYVPFLTAALASLISKDSVDTVEAQFRDERDVRDYQNFLAFWQQAENTRWFEEKLRVSHRWYNDRLDMTDVDEPMLRFFSRFRNDIKEPFTRESFQAYLTENGHFHVLPAPPTEFTYEQSLRVANDYGRLENELVTVNNLMSWIVTGDNDMRLCLHDIAVLRHVLNEAFERLRARANKVTRPPTEFIRRRSLIEYLVNAEREAPQIVERYVQYFSTSSTSPHPSTTGAASSSSSSSSYDPFAAILSVPQTSFGLSPSAFSSPSTTSSSTSPASPVYFSEDDNASSSYTRPERTQAASSSSPILVSDDDESVSAKMKIGATTEQVLPTRLESRIGHGIVICATSYMSRRRGHPDNRHRDFHHYSAYRGSTIGDNIGYVSYDPRRKEVAVLDYDDDMTRDALIGALRHSQHHVDTTRLPENARHIGDPMDDDNASVHDKTLTLDLTFEYTSRLAESGTTKERPYVLMVYLSNSYSKTQPFVINVEETPTVRQTLTFNVNRSYIPERVSLNIDSYGHYISESGSDDVNQAGFASVRLAKLIRSQRVRLDLQVPASTTHVIKGIVRITCNSSSLSPSADTISINHDREIKDIRRLVKKYITENREFYDKHPPVSRAIAHTTVFKFRCRQNYVPGALFDNFRLPQSREAYYLNSLRNALQLRLPASPITDVDASWRNLDKQTRLYTVLNMLTSYATACKYLKDSVDNNVKGEHWNERNVEEIDSFDTIRHTDNGDCEDKAKEILLHATELKYNSADFKSPVFAEIREILNAFIFCASLCAVSHSSINKQDFIERRTALDEHMKAHECAVAIPNHTFFLALSRSSPDHPLFDLYTKEEQQRGKGERLYILEGTGSLSPEPREGTDYRDEIQIAYEEGMSHESTNHLTEQFFYDIQSDDSFYKIIVNIMTPEFYLRTGYIGFEFLVVNEDGHRGVFFSDLLEIGKNPNVKIVETPRLSPLTFNRSMRITDDNFPAIALEAPLAITDAMLAVARRLTFQMDPSRPTVPSHEHCFIVQCLFEHMTEKKIQSIVADARAQKMNVVCYVESIKPTYISNQPFGRYTLIFY